ncbi:MAG: ankyrin repeat domain-containing protein [Opitutaceae bacterium]|nr:ankyrin repeat domain-containing protein [Opitutaceae bacterium]
MDDEAKESFITSAEDGDLGSVALYLSQNGSPCVRDSLSRTALHEAVVGGHHAIVELLIAHGAEIDAKDSNGTTPLMEAASVGDLDLIQKLLRAGADPALSDAFGARASDYAAAQGFEVAANQLRR